MAERRVGIAALFSGKAGSTPPPSRSASSTGSSKRVTGVRPAKRALASSGASKKKAKPSAPEQLSRLWSEEHAPASSAELSTTIHSGTLNRVREWLEAATAPRDLSRNASSQQSSRSTSESEPAGGQRPLPSPPKRLLILCGQPGTGKSACVRVLAQELQLRLSEHHDTFGQFKTWQGSDGENERMLPDPSRDDAFEASLDRDFRSPYLSQIDLFRKFLRSGSYEPLQLGFLQPARLKEKSTGAPSSNYSSTLSSRNSSSSGGRHTVLLIESLPSTSPHASSFGGSDRSLSESPLEQLRASLVDFLSNALAAPAVLVFSDVAEKSDSVAALERLFSSAITASPLVDIIQFNAITELKAKKRLHQILDAEKVRSMPPSEVEDIAAHCHGDLRQAINDLQLRAMPRQQSRPAKAKLRPPSSSVSTSSANVSWSSDLWSSSTSCSSSSAKSSSSAALPVAAASAAVAAPVHEQSGSDTRLSNLHVIAKVLQGIKPNTSLSGSSSNSKKSANSTGAPAVWAPEGLLEQCDLGPDAAASFLQHNCVEYYGDIDDLAKGLAGYSDQDQFVARMYSTSNSREQGDLHFPEEYALSLAARAVSGTNSQPCAERLRAFRAITKSKLHEAAKVRLSTQAALRSSLQRATGLDTQSHPSATRDVLPYLKFFSAPNDGRSNKGAVELSMSDSASEDNGEPPPPPVEEIDEF